MTTTKPPGNTGVPPLPGVTSRPAEARRTAEVDGARILDQLRIGHRETVLARVAEVSRQGQAPAELRLDIRGQTLGVQAAVGQTELTPGDWIRVLRSGNELQLLGKLADTAGPTLARALIQRLPWQHNLGEGLALLARSLSQGLKAQAVPGQLPSAQSVQPLPEAARTALAQVLAALPRAGEVHPGAGRNDDVVAQIRQWLQDSGLFAESRLLRSGTPPPTDLKLALAQVATALLAEQGQPPDTFNRLTPMTSPELLQAPLSFPQNAALSSARPDSEPLTVGQALRLLAGMLNRITSNQLHSQVLATRAGAETGGGPALTLLLELPWLNAQQEPRVAQLRLEYEGEQGERRRRQRVSAGEWRVTLAMELDRAGALQFEVALRTGSVSARVWAEKPSTLRQVNRELPLLRRSLADLGLEVAELETRQGRPRHPETRIEHRLVDTRA